MATEPFISSITRLAGDNSFYGPKIKTVDTEVFNYGQNLIDYYGTLVNNYIYNGKSSCLLQSGLSSNIFPFSSLFNSSTFNFLTAGLDFPNIIPIRMYSYSYGQFAMLTRKSPVFGGINPFGSIIDPNKSMYVFGNNQYGQLSGSLVNKIDSPIAVGGNWKLDNSIAIGQTYMVAISANGDVYESGYEPIEVNETTCNIDNNYTVTLSSNYSGGLRKVDATYEIEYENMYFDKSFSAPGCFVGLSGNTIFVQPSDTTYSPVKFNRYRGLFSYVVQNPFKIPGQFKDIAFGGIIYNITSGVSFIDNASSYIGYNNIQYYLLSADGTVFTWSRSYERLTSLPLTGYYEFAYNTGTWSLSSNLNLKINKMFPQASGLLAISTDNRIFACGDVNKRGSMGIDPLNVPSRRSIDEWILVPGLSAIGGNVSSGSILNIFSNSFQTWILSADNRLFATGMNNWGNLGVSLSLTPNLSTYNFLPVYTNKGTFKKVIPIMDEFYTPGSFLRNKLPRGGLYPNLFITTDNKIYSCGFMYTSTSQQASYSTNCCGMYRATGSEGPSNEYFSNDYVYLSAINIVDGVNCGPTTYLLDDANKVYVCGETAGTAAGFLGSSSQSTAKISLTSFRLLSAVNDAINNPPARTNTFPFTAQGLKYYGGPRINYAWLSLTNPRSNYGGQITFLSGNKEFSKNYFNPLTKTSEPPSPLPADLISTDNPPGNLWNITPPYQNNFYYTPDDYITKRIIFKKLNDNPKFEKVFSFITYDYRGSCFIGLSGKSIFIKGNNTYFKVGNNYPRIISKWTKIAFGEEITDVKPFVSVYSDYDTTDGVLFETKSNKILFGGDTRYLSFYPLTSSFYRSTYTPLQGNTGETGGLTYVFDKFYDKFYYLFQQSIPDADTGPVFISNGRLYSKYANLYTGDDYPYCFDSLAVRHPTLTAFYENLPNNVIDVRSNFVHATTGLKLSAFPLVYVSITSGLSSTYFSTLSGGYRNIDGMYVYDNNKGYYTLQDSGHNTVAFSGSNTEISLRNSFVDYSDIRPLYKGIPGSPALSSINGWYIFGKFSNIDPNFQAPNFYSLTPTLTSCIVFGIFTDFNDLNSTQPRSGSYNNKFPASNYLNAPGYRYSTSIPNVTLIYNIDPTLEIAVNCVQRQIYPGSIINERGIQFKTDRNTGTINFNMTGTRGFYDIGVRKNNENIWTRNGETYTNSASVTANSNYLYSIKPVAPISRSGLQYRALSGSMRGIDLSNCGITYFSSGNNAPVTLDYNPNDSNNYYRIDYINLSNNSLTGRLNIVNRPRFTDNTATLAPFAANKNIFAGYTTITVGSLDLSNNPGISAVGTFFVDNVFKANNCSLSSIERMPTVLSKVIEICDNRTPIRTTQNMFDNVEYLNLSGCTKFYGGIEFYTAKSSTGASCLYLNLNNTTLSGLSIRTGANQSWGKEIYARNCRNLTSISLSGFNTTSSGSIMDLTNCNLDSSALTGIFHGLYNFNLLNGTNVIYISGNPGAATVGTDGSIAVARSRWFDVNIVRYIDVVGAGSLEYNGTYTYSPPQYITNSRSWDRYVGGVRYRVLQIFNTPPAPSSSIWSISKVTDPGTPTQYSHSTNTDIYNILPSGIPTSGWTVSSGLAPAPTLVLRG
jgi:hypothetical protein